MVLRAPAVVVLHRLSRPLLSLPSWSLWRRPLLGLLPLLAGFHSGSANERPAGERRAGAESGPVFLAVASLGAGSLAASPRSSLPSSRLDVTWPLLSGNERAEWWPWPSSGCLAILYLTL